MVSLGAADETRKRRENRFQSSVALRPSVVYFAAGPPFGCFCPAMTKAPKAANAPAINHKVLRSEGTPLVEVVVVLSAGGVAGGLVAFGPMFVAEAGFEEICAEGEG